MNTDSLHGIDECIHICILHTILEGIFNLFTLIFNFKAFIKIEFSDLSVILHMKV